MNIVVIDSLSVNSGSLHGGTLITMEGLGFGFDPVAVEADIIGIPFVVVSVTHDRLVLEAPSELTPPVLNTYKGECL